MTTLVKESPQIITIFVSSPGDVAEERDLMDEIIHNYNQFIGRPKSIILQTIRWEKTVIPQVGADDPQAIVDQQTPDYDIYIGILKQRFGTPTTSYGSGTEQELRTALAAYEQNGRPWVTLYFNNAPFLPFEKEEDIRQYQKVFNLRQEVEKKGIIGKYTTVRGSSDGFYEKMSNHLPMMIDMILKTKAKKQAEELKDTVTQGAGSPQPDSSIQQVPDLRRPLLEVIGPTYLLDKNFYFIDWNPTFDLLLANPLGLSRGDHGIDLIKSLDNCNSVIERSKTVFGSGKDPLVDTECLCFKSPNYGLIEFQKIASRINCADTGQPAWSVNLNILRAERNDQLWKDIEQNLRDAVNWSRYASSYDKLLEPFDDYQQLIDTIVDKVGESAVCIDLGAGTGNGTLRLLSRHPNRKVWAVESNEEMIRLLKKKTDAYIERLTLLKDDIIRLGRLRHQKNHFDAAIMINVLYAVKDPQQCLRRVYDILKPGGVLCLSTPNCKTDVNRLLGQMRDVLTKKNAFTQLAAEFANATLVHRQLETLIHRDSPNDVKRYVEEAGFQISDWQEGEYVESVIVVKAMKPFV